MDYEGIIWNLEEIPLYYKIRENIITEESMKNQEKSY